MYENTLYCIHNVHAAYATQPRPLVKIQYIFFGSATLYRQYVHRFHPSFKINPIAMTCPLRSIYASPTLLYTPFLPLPHHSHSGSASALHSGKGEAAADIERPSLRAGVQRREGVADCLNGTRVEEHATADIQRLKPHLAARAHETKTAAKQSNTFSEMPNKTERGTAEWRQGSVKCDSHTTFANLTICITHAE